jgi:endonuclease YncB( thermonuclease family)
MPLVPEVNSPDRYVAPGRPDVRGALCTRKNFFRPKFFGIFINGMKKPRLTLLMVFLTAPLLASETYTGKCVGVHDGDTISVMHSGKAVKIRLEGIDCPELGQDFGTRAKQFTSAMVFGKDVQVKEYNLDMYGRMVARVYVEAKDLSLELVKAGLAWHYKHYSSDPVLAEAEVRARRAKTGLWSMPNPVPPGEYRKLHRRLGEAGSAGPPLLVRDAVGGGDMPQY